MDDCYALKDRGPDGRIQIDLARFPSGFGAEPSTLTSFIHAQGLKVWVYSGTYSVGCEGYPGTLGNEQLDADTFANWTADLLKLDNCQYAGDPTSAYAKVGAALNATGRPIFYMACSWGTNNPWVELPGIANSFRIDHDNSPNFDDMLRIISNAEGLARFAGPGHWLDLDMLEVGNLGDEDWYTTTHLEVDKAQFAIWCLYKSALTLGTTIENLQNETYKNILTNRELIAWNQDKLGIAGDVVRHEGRKVPLTRKCWVLPRRASPNPHDNLCVPLPFPTQRTGGSPARSRTARAPLCSSTRTRRGRLWTSTCSTSTSRTSA